MTDPIASASILIRPDTTKFRALLEAELRTAIAKPIAIPVAPTPITGAATQSIAQATTAATGLARANTQVTKTATSAAAASAEHARSLGQLQRGAAATTLSMAGIRGATLAASGAFLAGAAAIALFAKSIGTATSLTGQLAVLQETTGATAGEMEQVSAAAKEMGRDLTLPGISAGDAATAMTELAKAGLSVRDSIAGARGVLQLAIAANISFADATQLAASALNAFGLEGTDAVRVADVLANAANAAQGSISDMGLALQQAAAVGRQVGLSLEDTTTFLTQMAREGIRGSDAGTSLRVTLGRLINPTEKISAELEKLGVSLRDAQGNIRPDFFVNLGIAMQGMTKAQKDATLAIIGGMDGMRALSILTRQTIGDTIGLSNQLQKQGTAADLAKARMTGLTGASANFANTMQNIGLSIGRSVTPALTGFTNAMTNVAATLGSIVGTINRVFGVGPILAGIAAFKLLPPVLLATANAARGMAAALLIDIAVMRTAAGGAFTLRTAMIGLTAALTPSPMLVAAAAIGGLVFFFSRYKSAAEQAKNATDEFLRSLERVTSATEGLEAAQRSLETDKLAVQQGFVNVALARQAIALSGAKRGSIEYRQLTNNLAVAQNQLRISQEALRDTQEQLALTQEQLAIEQEKQAAAAERAASEIDDLIAHHETGAGSTQSFAESLSNATDRLYELAEAHRAEATADSIALAKREKAIAQLQEQLGRFATPTEVRILLDADTVEQGLREIEANLIRTGEEGGRGFADRVLIDPERAFRYMVDSQFFGQGPSIINAFGLIGSQSGANFGNQLIAAVQAAMALVQNLIAQAAAASAAVTTTAAQRIGLAEAAGDVSGALAISRRRENMFQRIADAAKARGDQETYTKAIDELISAQNESNSLEAQLAAQAAAGAKVTAAAAKSADDAREKADRAVQALFEAKLERLEIKLAVAENTKQLKDDIAAQVGIRNLMVAQIAIYKKQINDSALEAELVRELRLKIVQTKGTIRQLYEDLRDLRRERRKAREERKKERREERLEALRLNIQIAEANENIDAERRARVNLINALIKARRLTTEGTNAYRRLTLEIAQERKALRELLDETKERGKIAQSLQFEFMRQQQGFAATLLGNLIPAGAARGTVGSGTTGLRFPGAQPQAGAKTVVGGLAAGAGLGVAGITATGLAAGAGLGVAGAKADITAGGAPRGATQAQTGTMIEILRSILRVLSKQSRNAAVPESQYNKATGSSRSNVVE